MMSNESNNSNRGRDRFHSVSEASEYSENASAAPTNPPGATPIGSRDRFGAAAPIGSNAASRQLPESTSTPPSPAARHANTPPAYTPPTPASNTSFSTGSSGVRPRPAASPATPLPAYSAGARLPAVSHLGRKGNSLRIIASVALVGCLMALAFNMLGSTPSARDAEHHVTVPSPSPAEAEQLRRQEELKQQATTEANAARQAMQEATSWLDSLAMIGKNNQFSSGQSIEDTKKQLDAKFDEIIARLRSLNRDHCSAEFRQALVQNFDAWDDVKDSANETLNFFEQTNSFGNAANLALQAFWSFVFCSPSDAAQATLHQGQSIAERFRANRIKVMDTFHTAEQIAERDGAAGGNGSR
jgi:hypothetical protein